MRQTLSILAVLVILALPIVAVAQAPVVVPPPEPVVTPIQPWPLPMPSGNVGWKAVGLMLLAGAITTFGTAGLREGMRRAGAELPPVAMPAVTIGVGIGMSYLNAYLLSRGLPAVPLPPPEVLSPAITGVVAGGVGSALFKTRKEVVERRNGRAERGPAE